ALMEMFSKQINRTVEERVEEVLKERMKQEKEQIKVENRIITICTVFENGGTDETAKQYLNATEDELKKAHEYLKKNRRK
ncbi:MAG: hypothetical protein ACI4HI_08920, partial [Lachnospiraceae bacterium]